MTSSYRKPISCWPKLHSLHAGRPDDGVVDVVLVRRRQALVVGAPRLLVGRVEHQELQLGAGHRHVARLGRPVDLRLQDRPGRLHDGLVVQPHQVALDHDRRREVRQHADRVEVEGELHVAVALLPRAHGVSLDGVHVDVDAEQVVAPLGALLDDDVQEVRRVQALALQPALHVGEGHDDRVDVSFTDLHTELLQAQQPRVARAHAWVAISR
jgi:hypothetical protein